MRGHYTIRKGGRVVASGDNIITDLGRDILAAYLAKEVSTWFSFFQVGVGEETPLATDYTLEFYSGQTDADYSESSPATHQVTVRGTLPPDMAGIFYEVGLVNADSATSSVENVIFTTNFDASEGFVMGNYSMDEAYARNGEQAVRLVPLDAATEYYRISNVFQGYDSLGENDIYKLAYANVNANTSQVAVRYETDADNYYEYTFAPNSGQVYNVHSWTRGEFVATGSPSWGNIQAVSVHATGSGGQGDIHFDGLYASQVRPAEGYGLVSRAALGSPIVKEAGEEVEITYTLDFNF